MLHLSLSTMTRVLLICILSYNALASSTTPAQAREEVSSISGSQAEKTEQIDRFNPVVERPSEVTATTLESPQEAVAPSGTAAVFIENTGQFDRRVRFQTQIEEATVHFMDDSIWLTLLEAIEPALASDSSPFESPKRQELPAMKERKGAHVKMDVMGSNPHSEIVPFGAIETHYSYFLGASAADFRTDVPAWQGIRYVDIFPGMDMEIKNAGDHVAWEFIMTDPALFYENNRNVVNQGIRLHLAGQRRLSRNNNSVDVTTEVGSLVFPEIFLNGNQVSPQLDNNQVVIPIPPQTASVPTVRDRFHSTSYETDRGTNAIEATGTVNAPALLGPSEALLYSSYFGGSVPLYQYSPYANDIGSGLAVAGNMVYFTGVTQSADFLQNAVPQSTGVFDALSNVTRPFIAKLNIDTNQFEFISYFYLDHYCYAAGYYHILTGRFFSIQVDALGNVYAGGANPRTDFPMVNAIDTQLTGTCSVTLNSQGVPVSWYHPEDGFLVKLNPTGTQLLFSSYLGGLYEDKITNIALDPSGALYAAGYTYSNDIPALVGGYDTSQNGGLDVFVTKIYANSGSQAYFSYLGGSSTDNPYGITVGQDGSLYIAGRTFSSNFPTLPTSTGNTCPTCFSDGFVTKLNPTGGLAYSRFLGGTAGDVGFSVAVDQSNQAHVVGVSSSPGFPIATTRTDIDTFVLKLNPAGDTIYAERLGGATDDFGLAIAVDNTGKIYVAGETLSMDFPWTPNAYDQTGDAQRDLFISKIDPEKKLLLYSTYLGGSSTETIAPYIVVNDQGEIYLQVSQTISSDFPYTANAFDTTYNNHIDMMIVKMSTNVPLVDCSSVTLSPIAQAVKDATLESEYYCGNYYDSEDTGDGQIGLITLPPGQEAFERFDTLASTALHEVDFANMGWAADSVNGEVDSAGEFFLQGVKALYDNVQLNPTNFPDGVRVRILVGLQYYTGTECQDQRVTVLNDMAELQIPRTAPRWNIEVAAYREGRGAAENCILKYFDEAKGIHSHAKLMVVDGKHVIASGYNMLNSYLRELGPIHDMGIQISGPIAYRSLQAFDELWALASRCDNDACTAESPTESFQSIPHDLKVRIPTMAGNDAAFSLFRDHIYKTADNAIAAAIEAASSEVNIIQNRFMNTSLYNPPQYVTGILNAIEKDTVTIRLIVSSGAGILDPGGQLDHATNLQGVCKLHEQIRQQDPADLLRFDARFSTYANPIHTKALSIDDSFLIVGSQNFDASAWGSGTGGLQFGDLAEYSLGVDSVQAASHFQSKYTEEWNAGVKPECLDDGITGIALQDAINQAAPGSAIVIPPGALTGSITIDKPLFLVGAGANQTIIQPAGNQAAFRITSSDVTIMNMEISHGAAYGIELVDSSPSSLKNIRISGVVFENNAQGGILAQGLISGSPMNYFIENNTFIEGIDGVTINMVGTQAEPSFIRNNIFLGQSNAPIRILSTNDSHLEYSYNLFDDCGLGACSVNWRSGNMSTVSSAHDNLFDLNPLFANAPKGAYQLSAGSPAIDAGDPSSLHQFLYDGDNDGTVRIDMGAFEYIPGTNAAPVVNAGNNQTVNLGSSTVVNTTYSDTNDPENHSAKIDWGDGSVEDVPVNMTGPGAGEVNAQHTYSSIGNYTAEVCVTDVHGGAGCDTLNVEVVSTSTPTPTATETPTNTPTTTPGSTPTYTSTATSTPTATATATATNTPTDTPTNTPTDTPTSTPTNTSTPTLTPTNTPTTPPNACTPSNSYGFAQGAFQFASFRLAANSTNFSRLPLSFVPNRGQEEQAVKFQARGLGGNLFFTPSEVVFSLPNPVKVVENDRANVRYDLHPANVVRIHYQDANENPQVVALGQLPGVVNILKGNNPSRWRTNLPTYSGIAYRELYPGIELRYEGPGGQLKSTFHVAPGADPSDIIWRYRGVDRLGTDAAGNLVVNLPEPAGAGAMLLEQAPVAWQEVGGNRIMVPVQYAVSDNEKKVSFVFPDGYDSSLPLVIDPTITYSTYLGGVRTDEGHAITLDADCNVYVTGDTSSSNFPTVNPFQQNPPTKDIFVSKLNPAGDTLLYSTYIGGNASDQAWGIALDSQGRITVVGESESSDFPRQNAYDNTFGGGTCEDSEPCDDVVVLQLIPDGSALRYSTYLGGTQQDNGYALAIGPGDTIHITGATRSSGFPAKNAFDTTFGGGTCSGTPCYDAFVSTIDPSLTGSASLLYSTFLGNNDYDDGMGIAVDSAGHVYITGYTRSDGFPARNAYRATRVGSTDAFIAKFNTTLSGDASLLYSSYFGGTGDDRAFGIALNGVNQVYLTGFTKSTNFPMANPFDNSFGGGTCGSSTCTDAFVTHLNIGNNTLAYSSYLGGSHHEEGAGITVDDNGNVYVTGFTRSTNFNTLNPIQPAKASDSCSAVPCADAFLTNVSSTGALVYSSYLGGTAEDYGMAVVLDGLGNTYLTGYTFSSSFPDAVNQFVGESGYADAFIVKIED